MKEIIRIRCPLCGMMPSENNLKQTEEEKPAEVRVFICRFYGKVKAEEVPGVLYKKKGRGSAPGRIEYEDVTEQEEELLKKYQDWFDKRIEQYQGGE